MIRLAILFLIAILTWRGHIAVSSPPMVAAVATKSQGAPGGGGGEEQVFVLADFDTTGATGTTVWDVAWIQSQPPGISAHVVEAKADAGPVNWSIDVGGGPDGSNCLKVTNPTGPAGNPNGGVIAFWLFERHSPDGGLSSGANQYITPWDPPLEYNVLEFDIRFDPGFKEALSDNQPPIWPNNENFHIGTYNSSAFSSSFQETDNWHFYYLIWLRHDIKNNGEWFHVEVRKHPQFQRGFTQNYLGWDPTSRYADFWGCCTDIYLMSLTQDPEIGYPCSMWVDNVQFRHAPESYGITMSWDSKGPGFNKYIAPNDNSPEIPFTITNSSASAIDVTIAFAGANSGIMKIGGVTKASHDTFSLPVGNTSGTYQITPGASVTNNSSSGVLLVPNAERTGAGVSTNNQPSHSDSAVEKRWGNVGSETIAPHDAEMYGVTVVVWNAKHWAQSTVYGIFDRVIANGNVYRAAHGSPGTSAGSGTGPSGTGTGITDGTCTWDYIQAYYD